MNNNKVILFLLLAFASQLLFSQDLKTTEIKVEEGFIPEIPDANRLNKKAFFQDTATEVIEQEYTLIEEKLHSDYQVKPLSPAKVKDKKPHAIKPFNFYVLGGNLFRLKGLYNSKIEEDVSYGILFDHNTKLFKVRSRKANSAFNKLHIYFKKDMSQYIISTNLDFEKNSGYTYVNNTSVDDSELKTRFSFSKLSFNILNKNLENRKWRYNTNLFISDLNEFSENRIHFSSLIKKDIKDFPFSIDLQLDNYINYNSKQDIVGLEKQNITRISIAPSVGLQKFDINFDATLGIDYQSDEGLHLFPCLIATKELVEDIILVQAGIQDNAYRNTFKSLSDENLYIHNWGTNQILISSDTLLDLRTTESKEFFISMKNVLSKNEVFFGKLTFSKIENQQVFELNKRTNYNRFIVAYYEVDQIHIESEYERQINDIVDLIFSGSYYYWTEKLPHKSNLVIDATSSINLRDKIILKPSLNYFSKRYDGIDQFLPALIHINLNMEYRYSKNLIAYIELNNINNSKHSFWKEYQSIGFHGALGVGYSF